MKVKHGQSIEITDQLSSKAATAFACWIGCSTVIYNQKVVKSQTDYAAWIAKGKPEDARPETNTQVAYLNAELPFLKEIPAQIRRNAGAKWFEAVNAAKIGLRKPPKVKPKHKKRNCYVTNELFDVQDLSDDRCLIQIKRDATQKSKGHYLAGVVIPCKAVDVGKAFYLSRKGARFWLSICHNKEFDVLTETDVKALLVSLTDEQLDEQIKGYDLGVKRQVTGSDGKVYHLPDQAQQALAKLEARKCRYQRKYARMARANDKKAKTKKRKRTKGEKKLSLKISKYAEKKAHIQKNNSHHISTRIAENTPLCAVFEDMKLANMVRRPKARLCPETGRWLSNGAKAKAGLNKAILGANMGQIRQFTQYKLADRGKLLIKVRPHHSSQECEMCGFTHKDNRPTQALFLCQRCDHTANADDNAARVLKKRGITLIRSETFSKEKTARKTRVRRNVTIISKGHELASSGSGEAIRLSSTANLGDALHSDLTVSRNGLSETRRL